MSLPCWLPALVSLARDGQAPGLPDPVRLAAAMLEESLDGLADVLRKRVPRLDGDTRDDVFRAFAADHRVS